MRLCIKKIYCNSCQKLVRGCEQRGLTATPIFCALNAAGSSGSGKVSLGGICEGVTDGQAGLLRGPRC